MTFDDGILKIYKKTNISKKGDKPKDGYIYKSSSYFGYEDVGWNRFFTAKNVKSNIECLVRIQFDRSILSDDIVEFEDGTKFEVIQAQHPLDENNLRFTRLSLGRIV